MKGLHPGLRRFWLLAALAGLGSVSAHATTIVVYGASGSIGSVITQEALRRGDTVIGVARDASKMHFSQHNFMAVAGDVTNLASFKTITHGADAVIISVVGNGEGNKPENSTQAVAAKVAVEAYSGVQRSPHVIEIGGATTMYESRAAMLAHLPAPAPPGSAMYGMFVGHLVALQTYRASRIHWTVLTPPLQIQGWSATAAPVPKRTGKYRVSTTDLVRDSQGQSVINIADLAVAAVDEAEHPRFVGRRFTVGY
ncbi:MAG TPA: NAD(P)H-binding protein [Steroidobacteraceae bacterium]|nr:NAD(P)H-binding protein [Steroidobacteraceae bacterium]